jgi:hypothetical protein
MQNYFLSVYDDRLEDKDDVSKEVNDVTLRIGGESGGDGNYFDLCTAELGIGIKVSKETIRTYMERYEVEANHLQELFEVEWPKSNIPPSIQKQLEKITQNFN